MLVSVPFDLRPDLGADHAAHRDAEYRHAGQPAPDLNWSSNVLQCLRAAVSPAFAQGGHDVRKLLIALTQTDAVLPE